jgi:hypothetical protein
MVLERIKSVKIRETLTKYLVSMMITYKIIGLMIGVFVSASAGLLAVNHMIDTTHVDVISPQDSDFHKEIMNNANEVDNAVQATLAGQENAADAIYVINDHIQATVHDATYSADQRQINNRYKAYLNAAYTTTIDYVSKQGNITNDVTVMCEKKSEI